MESIGLAGLLTWGTPALLLALIILSVYQSAIIRQLQKEVANMKSATGVVWADTYQSRKEDIDRRLNRLENRVFNNKSN